MSADIFLFHSDEVNDPALLAPGWYIGTAEPGAEALTTEGAIGPYPTNNDAARAMASGAYLKGTP